MPQKAALLLVCLLLISGMLRRPASLASGFSPDRQAPVAAAVSQDQASSALRQEGTATAETTPSATVEPTASATATLSPPAVSVTGVEPGRISQETGGPLSIYGRGFTPGIAVRLVGHGLLDSAVVNENAIRAAVPPGVPEGTYDLEVILPGGEVQTVKQAVRIRSSIPAPTETATPGPALAYNQPQILIRSARTDPEILTPGEPFSLRLELVNRGDVTATNIRVALSPSTIAVPVGGSSLSVIDALKSGETAALELSLALNEATPTGYHNLGLQLNYTDYYRREFSSEQSIGVSAGPGLGSQPLVLLTSYRTDPEALSPGDTFTLILELTNVGQSDARQVLLTLGGEGSAGLTPFAILGSGNIQHVPLLPPGGAAEVKQRLILDGSANAGVFQLPVTLTYRGSGAEPLTETQVLNLIASRRPQLKIDYYRSLEIGKIGQPMELPIEMINIGRNLVNVSTVSVSSPALDIEDGVEFIGPLDGGTSGTLDVVVVPRMSGTHSVLVTVNYLDDFNQPKEITTMLPIVVEEEAVVSPEDTAQETDDEELSFWARLGRILRGLFGLGS